MALPNLLKARLAFLRTVLYTTAGQLAASKPSVAHHIVFSGSWKHSGKIFKSNISSNLSQQMLVLRC